MQLADMGADVVKVEDPSGGDYMRWTPPLVEGQSALFNALNRNKRSLALNLKLNAGRELLLELARTADVLVEGNRPGVMDRLGLGWPVLHAANKKLVMCSITGYGQDGPFASRAGHDINYMAVAGALGLNGPHDGPPIPLSVQVADIGGGGLQAAVAILGALIDVQRGGDGRWIDASMLDGAVSWLSLLFAAHAAGEKVGRGDQRLAGRYACYRVYECRGGGFYSVGALEPKFWVALCEALERPELAERQFSEEPAFQAIFEDIFMTHSRAEWEEILAPLDACCEPVLELDEVSSHPQIAARGLLNDGEVRPAVLLQQEWRRREPPGLGEHSAAILSEVGVDAPRFEELRAGGVTA